MSEPAVSQSPGGQHNADHRPSLEERLTSWEASNAARSVVDFEDSDFGKDPDHLRRVSLWWLIGLVWVISDVLGSHSVGRWWTAAAIAAFAAVYVVAMVLPKTGTSKVVGYGLAAVIIVAGPALATVNDSASVLAVIAAMGAALLLPLTRPAMSGVFIVVALSFLADLPHGISQSFDLAMGALLGGIVTWAIQQLVIMVAMLRSAREDLAKAAVAEERLRFARDLHDLLGHSLSMIVVKAEVVRRLADHDPAAAASAAGDIEQVGRKALDEVRQAVTGYRERRLSDELASARSSLAAAQVSLTVDDELTGEAGALSCDIESVLCWALRESVTNVVRHSHAQHCRIVLRHNGFTVTLLVRDDGPGVPAATVQEGNGLRGLTERVRATGGTATATATSAAGGFDVQVSIPHAYRGARP